MSKTKLKLILLIIVLVLISGCVEQLQKVEKIGCDLDYWRMCNETWEGEIKCEGDEEPLERMCGFKYTSECELCN